MLITASIDQNGEPISSADRFFSGLKTTGLALAVGGLYVGGLRFLNWATNRQQPAVAIQATHRKSTDLDDPAFLFALLGGNETPIYAGIPKP